MIAFPLLTPEEQRAEYKQGYKEGFDAGKAALRAELKALVKSLPDKQIFTHTSSTYINLTKD